MPCTHTEQLYWKRIGQYELLGLIIELLEKYDKETVLPKLRKTYVEIEMDFRYLGEQLDPLMSDLVNRLNINESLKPAKER